jgi:hypothetical protein
MDLIQDIHHRLLFTELPLHFTEKRLLLELEFADICALDLAILFELPRSLMPFNRTATRLNSLFIGFSEPEQCLNLGMTPRLVYLRGREEAWSAFVDRPTHASGRPYKLRLLWQITERVMGAYGDVA